VPCILKFIADLIDPKRFFIFSLIIHVVVYWFLIFFMYMRESGLLDSYYVDFYTVYMKATETFLHDPRLLYSEVEFSNVLVFRNLPASIIYFIPFFLLPSQGNVNLIIYSFFTLMWNMLVCVLLSKITKLDRWKVLVKNSCFKDAWWIMGIYLLSPLHVGEYSLGQTNVIAGLFILLALYFYLDGKEHYAFACVSFSLYFKISGLFLLFLLIFSKDMKRFITNLFYTILVQGPNIMMFLSWPTMLQHFVSLNFQAGEQYNIIAYKGWGTGSTGTLNVFLAQQFGASSTVTTIVMLAALIPVTLYTLHRRGRGLNEFDKWMLLILLFAISIPAFYMVHVFLYLGVYSCWLVLEDGKWSKMSKIILGIPTFSIFFWFYFPLIPFLYIFPFITLLKKAWGKKDVSRDINAV
jgi:hypothetical protein